MLITLLLLYIYVYIHIWTCWYLWYNLLLFHRFDELYIIIIECVSHPFCWNCRLVGKCRFPRLVGCWLKCLRALIRNGMGVNCWIFIPLCINFGTILLEHLFIIKRIIEMIIYVGAFVPRFCWSWLYFKKDFSAAKYYEINLCCWINSIFSIYEILKSSVTFRFAMKTLILRIFNYVGKTGGIRAGRSVRPSSRVVSSLVVLYDSLILSFVVLIVVCCVEN